MIGKPMLIQVVEQISKVPVYAEITTQLVTLELAHLERILGFCGYVYISKLKKKEEEGWVPHSIPPNWPPKPWYKIWQIVRSQNWYKKLLLSRWLHCLVLFT